MSKIVLESETNLSWYQKCPCCKKRFAVDVEVLIRTIREAEAKK